MATIIKSELAELKTDGTIWLNVQVNEGDVHGHGDERLKPSDASYNEIKRRFMLEKIGDCRIIDYEYRDGQWYEVGSRVPDGDAALNVTNL